MNNYLINNNTIALIQLKDKIKVIENDNIFYLKGKVYDIINISCKYYGSSLKGRIESSNYLLGTKYKSPIIVNEYDEIIMFPTSSPYKDDCIWINYSFINNYYSLNNRVYIDFINDVKLELNLSSRIINNQILKSSRLQSILKSKKT